MASLTVQQHFTKDPFGGDLWVFRGRSGSLVKIIWPSAKDGVVSLTSSQLACLLDGIDRRNPQYSWRDCQDFRVWAGIMGEKETHYVPTQGAGDSG